MSRATESVFARARLKVLSTRRSALSSTRHDPVLAGYIRGTRTTAADFVFLLGAAGARIVTAGLFGLRSLHGSGVSACFDSMVKGVAMRRKE